MLPDLIGLLLSRPGNRELAVVDDLSRQLKLVR